MRDPELRSNLPAQVSSFIGREAELAEVRRLVGVSRLVTLTGTGGAGKTRLGLRVAAELLDSARDGVWFADLAPLGDPELVAVTVADILGVRREPGRSVFGTLVDAVGGRSPLVLLDTRHGARCATGLGRAKRQSGRTDLPAAGRPSLQARTRRASR